MSVLLVAQNPVPGILDDVAGIEVGVSEPDVLDRVPASVDCVVDATDDPEPVVDADVPVVAFSRRGPEAAASPGYAGYVHRDDGGDRLAETVRWTVASAERRDDDPGESGTSRSTGEDEPGRPGDDPCREDPGSLATDDGRFQQLVESMADGVIVTHWDGTLAYLNRTAEAALGLDREDLLGRHVSAMAEEGVVPAADLAELESAADDLKEGGTMVTHELRVTPPEGQPRTVELRVVPAPPELGVDGALVTVRDVTRRRKTELALRESRERIANLHDAASTIVACRTEETLYEQAIEAAEGVLEFEVSSILIADGNYLVPKAISSGASEDSARPFRREEGLVGKTFRTGESFIVDDTTQDPVATPVASDYRSTISVPIGDYGVFQAVSTEPGDFDEDDLELAELLMAHVSETFARVRVEDRLREREQELVEERDRLAALFENVPDPCVAFDFEDGDPIVRAVNPEFEEVFGYDADAVVGEDIDEYVVPPGYETEAEELNESLQAGQRLRTTSRRRTDDGVRDFLLHVVPFNVGERTVQGYAIYTDITEQKERERKLREQNEQLDQFASMVSHDLRNPLNVAQGYLNLATETGDPDHYGQVRTAHERMDRMINELLQLARRGDVVGDTRPVELSETAAGAWETVDTKGAAFDVTDEVVLEADPERLAELLENLFRNAVEHGGPTVDVRVGSLAIDGETPDEAGFYVEDDGPGIPESERDRVFESGYTTRSEGTGFGLSIVSQIATAHGWSVAVTESAEGGARFEFRATGAEQPAAESPVPGKP